MLSFIFEVLVFALLVAVVVWLGLRIVALVVRDSTAAPDARTRWKRRAAAALLFVLVWGTAQFGTALQLAYGAPLGERTSNVYDVLEVGECERPWYGFGLVRWCDLVGYGVYDPDWNAEHPGAIVTGEALEPGDRVAKYDRADGWAAWLQIRNDPLWRQVSDTERPDLVWVPVATVAGMVLAAAGVGSWRRRAREAVRSR